MPSTTFTIIGSATALFIAYGVYFDYQRRTNPAFRKKLEDQRKEAKSMKATYETKAAKSSSIAIPDEPIPTTNEGREQYFMNHLQAGEQLMQQGITNLTQALHPLMLQQLASTKLYKFIQNHNDYWKFYRSLYQN